MFQFFISLKLGMIDSDGKRSELCEWLKIVFWFGSMDVGNIMPTAFVSIKFHGAIL